MRAIKAIASTSAYLVVFRVRLHTRRQKMVVLTRLYLSALYALVWFESMMIFRRKNALKFVKFYLPLVNNDRRFPPFHTRLRSE